MCVRLCSHSMHVLLCVCVSGEYDYSCVCVREYTHHDSPSTCISVVIIISYNSMCVCKYHYLTYVFSVTSCSVTVPVPAFVIVTAPPLPSAVHDVNSAFCIVSVFVELRLTANTLPPLVSRRTMSVNVEGFTSLRRLNALLGVIVNVAPTVRAITGAAANASF